VSYRIGNEAGRRRRRQLDQSFLVGDSRGDSRARFAFCLSRARSAVAWQLGGRRAALQCPPPAPGHPPSPARTDQVGGALHFRADDVVVPNRIVRVGKYRPHSAAATNATAAQCDLRHTITTITLADVGFFRGGDFGNPSEASEH